MQSPGIARVFAVLLAVSVVSLAAPAQAQDGPGCRVVEVQMTPTDYLQLVVWIEDAAGNYVDTAFITQLTGSRGLGNRPGMREFNTGYRWPYGRRAETFPVWSHRHGMTWPLVVFQNQGQDPLNFNPDDGKVSGDENLSHFVDESSREAYYCRPLTRNEMGMAPADARWQIDAQSCATSPGVYTDKGQFHAAMMSNYPPRSDFDTVELIDHPDAAMFAAMNPFDAVSRATPEGGIRFDTSWAIPRDLPDGEYVVWIEASSELDQNTNYSYPEPVGIPWGDYGIPGRGQPSVVWSVPVTIANETTNFGRSTEYVGYGDPDGIDGNIREPDPTITTDVPGSGASRLLLTADDEGMHRVKVIARAEDDDIAPAAAESVTLDEILPREVTLSLVNPGDDGDEGQLKSYEIRYLAGREITADNFEEGTIVPVSVTPGEPGSITTLTIPDLQPRTNYHFAIQPRDECLNLGPLTFVSATTPLPEGGEVDACFIATAAYGSLLAEKVTTLRRFRDLALRSHVTGELFVEAYYTFGPALAAVIRPSTTLRRAARTMLTPVADWASAVIR